MPVIGVPLPGEVDLCDVEAGTVSAHLEVELRIVRDEARRDVRVRAGCFMAFCSASRQQ
jgi:hypothetical protein